MNAKDWEKRQDSPTQGRADSPHTTKNAMLPMQNHWNLIDQPLHRGYKTPMLSAESFLEMWRALDEAEEAQIERLRAANQPARKALMVLWHQFHPQEPPPAIRQGRAAGNDADPSLISGVRFVIGHIDTHFTTNDVAVYLDKVLPELRARERRVSISSYLSRLVAEGYLMVSQRQTNGLANTYIKSAEWNESRHRLGSSEISPEVATRLLTLRDYLAERR